MRIKIPKRGRRRRVGLPLSGKMLLLSWPPVKDYSYAAGTVTTTRNEF